MRLGYINGVRFYIVQFVLFVLMEQKSMYIGIAVGIIVVLGLVYVFWPKASVSTVVLNFGGMPIYLHPVDGHDVECVGAPNGYTMVHFSEDSDVAGEYTTVGYAREGDHYEEALSWAKSRASACSFQKIEETSLAVPGAHGTSLHYEKGDEAALYFDVGVVKGSDGRDYTVIRVGYDKYYETAVGDQSSGASEGGASSAQEVPVSGDLKIWDDTIRPILEQVFGSVTLTSAVQPAPNSVGLDYVVSRAIAADDAQKLLDAFVSAGWAQMTVETSGEHFSLGFRKDSAFLGLDADVGGDTVSVTVFTTG